MPLDRKALRLQWRFPAQENQAGPAALHLMSLVTPTAAEGPPAWLADAAWIEVAGAATPKEELLALLTFGAEVEHALLVQYLYAMASLDRNGSPDTQTVRGAIHDIALQEMAHLVSVQNLLLAVGGPDYLHIGRDSLRTQSGNNPLPLALEPVSELTLSEYILAESPADVPPDQKQEIADLKALVKDKAGIEPHQVGMFYTQVYWLLQPDDQPHGPLVLTADASQGRKPGWHLTPADFTAPQIVADHQALPLEWRSGNGPNLLILPVGDAGTAPDKIADIALANVFSIMQQGEGVASVDNSHFEKFLNALDIQKAGHLDLLGLPRTPSAGQPPKDAPSSTPLVKEYTMLWGQLFDLRYTMLPMDILLTLSTTVTSPDRATLRLWAFASMLPILRGLMAQMTSPALTKVEPCGPTFGLLVDDVPLDPKKRWQIYLGLLQKESTVVAALEQRPELRLDTIGRNLLATIKNNSTQIRLPFVEKKAAS